MSAKRLFKTVFSTAVLVVLALMGWHNRTPVDFSMLPLSPQSFHGPVAFMYFAFFGVGVLLGMVISIRTKPKETPPASRTSDTTMTPRIRIAEPPVGSRIS